MIAAMPAEAEDAVRSAVADSVLEYDPSAVPAAVADGLSDEEQFGMQALALRQSSTYSEAKANRPHQSEDWDSGVAETPGCDIGVSEEEATELFAQAPTSSRMAGSIAVGIIIVEGPNTNLKFSSAERTKVVAEVQNGLGWLATQNPQGVSWHYEIKVVSLTVKPNSNDQSRKQKEVRWRDPAMKKLGYGKGIAGVQDYVEDLRKKKKTSWAYCAFFTKYPLGHFAYASIGGPRLVMDYANDGWGPDNIDRVFAHETGHIFGAPDEYASSNCNCGGSWGFYNKPNANCANCAPSGGVPCIMKSNAWDMCVHTPYHLGFPLVTQRYSGIWRGGNDGYYLWVNASWASFKKKWQQLANKNLRLVDLEITQAGSKQRFNGVWRAGKGGYYLWVNASWSSFKKKWEELAKKKLRLVDIEVKVVNGKLLYSGVWLPGSDAYYLWVNSSWSSFKKKWQELAKKNLRLVDIKSVKFGSSIRYFGVWRHGTGGYYLWVNATWSSFKKKWQELANKNLRLVDMEVTNYGGKRRYSGIWLPGNDGYYLWVNANWQSFRDKWEELAKKNLSLIDFEVTSPSDPAGSPILEGANIAGELSMDVGGIADDYKETTAPNNEFEEIPDEFTEDVNTGGGEVEFELSPGSTGEDDLENGMGGGTVGDGDDVAPDDDNDGFGGGSLESGESEGTDETVDDGFGGGDYSPEGVNAGTDPAEPVQDGLGGGVVA